MGSRQQREECVCCNVFACVVNNMKRNGFTFIEVIISITMFTLIMTTVYSVFYLGMKTWRRGEDRRSLQEIRSSLLRIDKELKDSFYFSKIPFKGTDKEMMFPLSAASDETEEIYTVTYVVDSDERTGLRELVRKKKIFSESLLGEELEEAEAVFPLMRSVDFEYGYEMPGGASDFEWREDWDAVIQNKFPSGIRISFELPDTKEFYAKTIFIPHGELGIR